jgi:acyl carrier protein
MSDELRNQLRDIISEVAEIDEVPDDTPFADLGIDSMMAMEIVAEVEREYKLEIPESEIGDLTHFNAVYEKVSRKLAEAS